MRALIIEDDAEMAGLVKRLLRRRFSIDASIAADCAAARGLLRSADFDLVTLDYRLPDGPGLDLLDEITTSIEHPPVIMVTGHGDEETAARSFRARASGYVVKDARLPDMLVGAVEKALSEIALKRVERELLDEKAFLEDALNTMPDLFLVLDIDGNFFRWNRVVPEVTGYCDHDIASMNILDLFQPADAGKLLDGIERMKSGDDLGPTPLGLVGRDGEKREFELNCRLLRSQDGTPMGFTGAAREVSGRARREPGPGGRPVERQEDPGQAPAERERARERLQAQSERLSLACSSLKSAQDTYQAIIEHSSDAFAVIDRAGVFLSVNPGGASIAGYRQQELLGRNIFELIHPDDLPHLMEIHEEAFGNPGTVGAVDLRMRQKGGGWRLLETIGHTFRNAGGTARVVVTARDVTEAREAEEEARKFKTIADRANYGVGIIDTSNRLVYVNDDFARAHGFEASELLGEPLGVFHRAEGQLERVNKLIEQVYDTGGYEAEEVWHTRKDGTVFPMLMSTFMIRDEEGNPLYTATTAIDISSLKDAERQLLRLNSELEGFARTVSHDLRSPLTSIKLAGEALERTWEKRDGIEDLDAEVFRIAEIIALCTRQAEELIRDLLALAMSGEEPDDISEVDVTTTVERVIEEQEPLIGETGASVRVEGDLGRVRANPIHVYQLFSNLISNAIKHNDKTKPEAVVRYLGSGGGLHRWSVEDNGPGIPEEDVENVFLPFFKGEHGCTGVGLAIVKRIVRLYGGSVLVSTNDGARFEFSLRDR